MKRTTLILKGTVPMTVTYSRPFVLSYSKASVFVRILSMNFI